MALVAKEKLFEGITIPVGPPGRMSCGTSYREKIRKGLRKKFGDAEGLEGAELEALNKKKEIWHLKHTAVRRRKVEILWKRDGRCVFCNISTSLEKRETGSGRNMATIDHILPQSMGGTDHLSNMVIACKACNSARGIMDFFEFANLRWSKSEKTFTMLMRHLRKKRQSQKLQAAKLAKKHETIWKLALLLYLHPEWNETVEAAKEEARAIAERKRERNRKAKLRKLSREEPGPAHSVPDASLSALPFLPLGSHDPAGHGPHLPC